jgi:hypothetical protein
MVDFFRLEENVNFHRKNNSCEICTLYHGFRAGNMLGSLRVDKIWS